MKIAISLLLFAISTSVLSYGDSEWFDLKDEEQLRKLFIEHSDLVDPFSVQFRHVRVKEDAVGDGRSMTSWCGQSNQKNKMGAYTGWTNFSAYIGIDGEAQVTVAHGKYAEMTQIVVDLTCKEKE